MAAKLNRPMLTGTEAALAASSPKPTEATSGSVYTMAGTRFQSMWPAFPAIHSATAAPSSSAFFACSKE